ncbi:EamA family transporter [Priestia megaterium]|jgi:drug/metabolite transporter (DMT)-like permease|uniref:EamA-like transporter family protein n=1 Tax=Priestia megaterium (strain ATCC 14581 / DSM 32 / CCUG 1817 / JCM 2506 / NBRC 15308 / NCIMB 9376 / NCTC 10342 / NRRL B-14308 / VKM B-512 / Ford 19) TaxID=1348623 RepID=A0A0B6ALU8_PRIM2|nr:MULTISPECIES: DMT family transporter [Priestia]AJI24456.1 eamA-like transporter family protein [Priestia megaterium NBRC 15308 = ATCC 14581]KFN06106.1 eamA-like transporter family protein [Priestia megaterium]KGJ82646.1 multidrug transporter [Priestia megaterium NBRC 15308 = ATCC 14581]MCU7707856.1 DMT family transporter [Priestia megaterium]MCW1047480.1 DMT family transporter [Priestia sp. JV24]
MNKSTLPLPPPVFLLIGVLAVSFSSILIKWSDAPASILGMYRLLFTVLLFLPFLPWRKMKILFKNSTVKEWLMLTVSGVFLGLHFLFWMESFSHTTVASAMILTALEPVFVVIGAYFLFKEKTSKVGIISILIAVSGSVIIASGDIGLSKTALYGDLLSILGTVAVSVHMLAGQELCRKMPSIIYSFAVFLIGGLVLFVYNVWTHISLTQYESKDWWIFLLLALIPNIFGHALFNWLLNYVGATTISMAILGEPIGAIILAYFLLGEMTTVSQLVGGMIVMISVMIFLKYKAEEPKKVIALQEKSNIS